ncbi:MAG: hypothetical protein F6K10_24655, partial [Moorea sp. SIO2B7]|nr:hypothetical protein [Moorena sp. SIO2B7]
NTLLAKRNPPRRVTSEQAQVIMKCFAQHPTPLFLQVSLDIASEWHSQTPYGESIAAFEEAAEAGVTGWVS